MKKTAAVKRGVKVLLLLLLSAAAFAEDFTNYYNSRFGFSLLPASFSASGLVEE